MKKETADRKGEMKTREKSRLTIKDIVELAGRAREQELACDLDLLLSTDVSHLVSQRSLKRKFKRRRRKMPEDIEKRRNMGKARRRRWIPWNSSRGGILGNTGEEKEISFERSRFFFNGEIFFSFIFFFLLLILSW